jgi:hypothetical protein
MVSVFMVKSWYNKMKILRKNLFCANGYGGKAAAKGRLFAPGVWGREAFKMPPLLPAER